MRVKKAGKVIFGADLTRDEQRGLDMEMERQMAEWDKKHGKELDSLVLYILHTEFGFGEGRLHKFHDIFINDLNALIERYELEKTDAVWLCTKKLKEHGIDIDNWD